MASSTNGEYHLDITNEAHTNVQDNSQEAGPRWLQESVEKVTTTVDYQEGAGTIGGPADTSEQTIIQDDLITKYNFSNTEPPVPPLPCNCATFSVDGEGTVTPSVLDDIPNGTKIYQIGSTCKYDDLAFVNDSVGYEKCVHTSYESPYDGVEGWVYRSQGGENWSSVQQGMEIENGMEFQSMLHNQCLTVHFSVNPKEGVEPTGWACVSCDKLIDVPYGSLAVETCQHPESQCCTYDRVVVSNDECSYEKCVDAIFQCDDHCVYAWCYRIPGGNWQGISGGLCINQDGLELGAFYC